MRKIGSNQHMMLGFMRQRGDRWSETDGWVWGAKGRTVSILESMIQYDLVTRHLERGVFVYRLSDAALEQADKAREALEVLRIDPPTLNSIQGR